LEDAIETIGGKDRVRDLSEGVELRTAAEGEVDPHYWMSAPNAIAMVQNAREALVEAAPAAADGIAERADILIGRLEDADREIRSLVDEIPADRRKVVTDHDALGYFLDEYGLEFLGSVFPSLDVSADPSARDIEDLVNLIRENDVHAIFAESAVNPQLAEAVAAETGATISDEPLYTEAPMRSTACCSMTRASFTTACSGAERTSAHLLGGTAGASLASQRGAHSRFAPEGDSRWLPSWRALTSRHRWAPSTTSGPSSRSFRASWRA
jgi:ABC-type Zn uptake system ZnuABC Zn-binding protein ZnuA